MSSQLPLHFTFANLAGRRMPSMPTREAQLEQRRLLLNPVARCVNEPTSRSTVTGFDPPIGTSQSPAF